MAFKQSKKQLEVQLATEKEMREHYESLFSTSIDELRFERLRLDFLENAIDEVLTICSDTLSCAVLENAMNRNELDKLIYAKLLFGMNTNEKEQEEQNDSYTDQEEDS